MNLPIDHLRDIQGLLIYGYGRLRHADYFMLHLGGDSERSKAFLEKITPEVGSAEKNPHKACYALAFGKTGLEKSGWEVSERTGFSRAFIEGMDTNHRNRILGDFDFNSSDHWEWGSKKSQSIDVLLISFAPDSDKLKHRRELLQQAMAEYQVQEVHSTLDTYLDRKEHFGFRDGISQPVIKGAGRPSGENEELNPGEFIFGYPNEYRKIPHSPIQIGENGSYLVFRQLEQKVKTFWNYLLEQTENRSVENAIYLAAKMVGRWPEGSPTTLTDDPNNSTFQKSNRFGFYEKDRLGLGCPHGAHIRRTNPRDSVEDNPSQSSKASRKHRILRRGRAYGKPLSASFDIEEMIKADDDNENRGLNFICFNTDIERQFEFVQHTWCNNQKFDGLYEEVDPISGVLGNGQEAKKTAFKIPERPFRRRISNIPAFVLMKGGGYFFFPGINAIQRIINKT